MSLLFSQFHLAIDCCLQYAVYQLEVYRVLTAGLFSRGILSSVFAIITFGQLGPRIESMKGSSHLLYLIVLLDLFVNASWLAFTFVISISGLYPGIER